MHTVIIRLPYTSGTLPPTTPRLLPLTTCHYQLGTKRSRYPSRKCSNLTRQTIQSIQRIYIAGTLQHKSFVLRLFCVVVGHHAGLSTTLFITYSPFFICACSRGRLCRAPDTKACLSSRSSEIYYNLSCEVTRKNYRVM